MKPPGKVLPRILLLALAIGLAPHLFAQGRVRYVKIETLLADYRGNEIAADQKYKNKTLVVTGVITRVADTSNANDKSDDSGSYMIWLGPLPKPDVKNGERKNADASSVIVCYFTRGKKSDLLKLRAGQVITIRGRCRGGKGASLENCVL
jgi:hypothetical protein